MIPKMFTDGLLLFTAFTWLFFICYLLAKRIRKENKKALEKYVIYWPKVNKEDEKMVDELMSDHYNNITFKPINSHAKKD
jgi:hypothetical protein